MSYLYDALVYSKNPTNVIQYSTFYNIRNHQPSVIKLANGDMLCVWGYFFEDAPDYNDVEIWGRKSSNNGRSWGNPYLILSIPVGFYGYDSPNLYQKTNGNIIMIVTLTKSDEGNWTQIWQYTSSNNGNTFGSGEIIYESSDYEAKDLNCSGSHRIIKTQSGRLLFPFNTFTTSAHYGANGITVAQVLYSDDEGVSWSKSATIMAVAGVDAERLLVESAIAQLPNATLLLMSRTRSGYVRISTSTNDGTTWTNPPTKSATLTASNASIWMSYNNGKLIAIVNRPEGGVIELAAGRIHLDLWKSDDSGSTWSFVSTIDYDGGVHVYTEPIIYDTGYSIKIFYSKYPYENSNQDLIFKELSYSEF